MAHTWAQSRTGSRRTSHVAMALVLATIATYMAASHPGAAWAQGGCAPRPSITPEVALAGPGRLQVTVCGGAPVLRSVTLVRGTNARALTITGQPIAIPSTLGSVAGAPVVFLLEQVSPDQAITVPLDVEDGCGHGPTFVGAGLSAWHAPAQVCLTRPSATPEVVALGASLLQVTVRGGAPPLLSATLKSVTGGHLIVDNQVYGGAFPLTINAKNGAPIVFLLERLQPGSAITVPMEVTDGCGPISTLVGIGSGPVAGRASIDAPAPSVSPAPVTGPTPGRAARRSRR